MSPRKVPFRDCATGLGRVFRATRAAVEAIRFEGGHLRRDIAAKAI